MEKQVQDYLHALAENYYIQLSELSADFLMDLGRSEEKQSDIANRYVNLFILLTKNYEFAKKAIQALKNAPTAT